VSDQSDQNPASAPYTYMTHWPQGTPKNGAAVLDFWRREGAIGDEAQAQQRLREVVLHCCSADGTVVGVCTAVPMTLPRLGQPMYYYRCFIGKSWRTSLASMHMLTAAKSVLEGYARANDFPCIGILMELENARFAKKLRMPVWYRLGFIYIGPSQRGLDLRIYYFRGAKLKRRP
jgi:hypothetical protein